MRYRVRYIDASGKSTTKAFEKKGDADAFDLAARAGTAPEVKLDQSEKRISFGEYAERWRVSRSIGQSLEYQFSAASRRRPSGCLRAKVIPDNPCKAVRLSAVRFNLLNAVLNAAVVDKDHVRSCLRNHLVSAFVCAPMTGLRRSTAWRSDKRPVRAITVTDVLEWRMSSLCSMLYRISSPPPSGLAPVKGCGSARS